MTKKQILIVEDESAIRELVAFNLEKENFTVTQAADGETALAAVRTTPPDLIVLDLMLPGIDGLSVCYMLKRDERLKHIPVIMLTAKTEESDQVIGLGIGADDYITKPFSPRVLVARINAVLRRREATESEEEEEMIERGGVKINPSRHEVHIGDREIRLTPIEFKVLHFLARRPGRVYTRQQIIDQAQGEDVMITERTVDVHVVALRKKLGDAADCIETVRGIGYKFKD